MPDSASARSRPQQDHPPAPAYPGALAAWKAPLMQFTAGLLLFETVTGLLIWLLPFTLSSQFMVLTHTAAGVLFLLAWPWYQTRHWLGVRTLPFTHLKVTGYSALALTLFALVTGLLLTYQGIFGNRISYLADALHIASGVACTLLAAVHVGSVVVRDRRRSEAKGAEAFRRARIGFYLRSAAVVLLLGLGTLFWQLSYKAPDLSYKLPDNYVMSYGPDRPFAPSLATTSTGGALDPKSLSGSAGCGVSGCHQQIYEEWQPSAHRYSSTDIAFQAVQKVMSQNEGPDATRYCAGCHDPIALFSGSKNIYDKDLSSPGAEEGVSCIACHRLIKTDLKGNASYVMGPPDFYAYELQKGALAGYLSKFLIRTYPKHHQEQYSPKLLKAPEYCGACHKQFIDEEVNNFGWVQLQNQYDNWRKSHWNEEGDPSKKRFCTSCHEHKGVEIPSGTNKRCPAITVSCRECHMRLVASQDPAAGDDSDFNRSPNDHMHRHHRFIGANQFMPSLLKNKGWREQIKLTEEWLQGKTVLPEIGFKWPAISKAYAQSSKLKPGLIRKPSGPVIPIRILQRTPHPQAGEEVAYAVEIRSRKVGHDFPTGPLDIIQCWVETTVSDATGKALYESGRLNDTHFIKKGSFVFKAEGVDSQGHLIDRHNLWELVGARFKRALFPGFTDSAEFKFQCPAEAPRKNKLPPDETHKFKLKEGVLGPLTIRARLLYRKINQHLLNIVTGRTDVTAPVTVMSTAELKVALKPAR